MHSSLVRLTTAMLFSLLSQTSQQTSKLYTVLNPAAHVLSVFQQVQPKYVL